MNKERKFYLRSNKWSSTEHEEEPIPLLGLVPESEWLQNQSDNKTLIGTQYLKNNILNSLYHRF